MEPHMTAVRQALSERSGDLLAHWNVCWLGGWQPR